MLAVNQLIRDFPEVELVLSDDGLQHYAMPRDLEICLFDGAQSIGNGRMLPAGPLRESLSRLNHVDWIICKAHIPEALTRWQPILMALRPLPLKALPNSLANPEKPPLKHEPVVALCAIGQPDSFFTLLADEGWQFEPIALPDHAQINAEVHAKLAGRTVLMTTKDAIKLRGQKLGWQAWEVPVQAEISRTDRDRILESIKQLLPVQMHQQVTIEE